MRFLSAVLLLAMVATASGTVTFERRWQWFGETIGRGVELAADGGYLVSGGTWVEGSRYGIVLAKTDSLGDTTWVRHILDTDAGGGYSCRLEDGGPAVLGTVNNRHVFVQKYGPAGDSAWTHTSETRGLVSAIIATPDSGCLAVGRLPDTMADFGAVKLGTDGHEDWVKYYEEPRVFESWAYGAARTNDRGYILCGDCTDYMDSYVRLVRTDSDGEAVWTGLYSGPVGPVLRSVRETADNGFVAVGEEFDTLAFKERLYVMRTDSVGDIVATVSFAPTGAAAKARAMAETGDGGYIVAGEARWFDSTRVWLVRLDGNGDTLWTCVLGGPEDETAYDIERTSDFGYVIAGASEALGGSLLLIKTDSLGQLMTGTAEHPEGMAGCELVIAPNPAAQGRAEVWYSLAATGPATVSVFDISGRSVLSVRLSGHSLTGSLSLDLSGFANGVYLVRLDAPGFTTTRQLVVEN